MKRLKKKKKVLLNTILTAGMERRKKKKHKKQVGIIAQHTSNEADAGREKPIPKFSVFLWKHSTLLSLSQTPIENNSTQKLKV